MNWADPATIGWLGLAIAALAAVITYRAWARRKISVWFRNGGLIAAPRDDEQIGVTLRGENVAQALYLIQLQIKCAGNRDVVMDSQSEFIQVDAADGVEFGSVRYSTPGKLKLEVTESTSKVQKFRFDLLKRGEAILLNYFVKSANGFENVILASQFPTTVHIRDVRKVTLATNRLDLWGGAFALAMLAGLAGGSFLLSQFLPVPTTDLLMTKEGKPVSLQNPHGASVDVCLATTDPWLQSECEAKPIIEVAQLEPAPTTLPPHYANTSPAWSRLLSVLSLIIGFVPIVFGKEIGNAIARLIERLRH